MKYEALYAAVLGAAPTVLVAYVLEHRWLTKEPQFGHKVLSFIIVSFIGLSAGLALIALTGDVTGADHTYALLVAVTLGVGIAGLVGELYEGVIRGV